MSAENPNFQPPAESSSISQTRKIAGLRPSGLPIRDIGTTVDIYLKIVKSVVKNQRERPKA